MAVLAEPVRNAAPEPGSNYKWIALSNTTLGLLMATINSSIVLIALPDIFRGIDINPLGPGNTSYLLWMIMGFLVVTAVLVVGFGRLGDMYGRVRMYNLGFVIFTVASILLAVTWQTGDVAALWLIGWRVVQGVGGAFIMANSSAILTDAFPVHQRGMALGINSVAAIAGSFIGLVIGGLLGPVDWKLVFLVSVPFGVFGTIWGYFKLRDNGRRTPAKMDWWGNITFAVGLVALLVGITYGIQPYGDSDMGWGSPLVLSCVIGGIAVLIAFGVIETKVANPLFTLSLFRNRAFTLGNVANLLASLGRGGLQFILIIWLQGIWLPQHGYSFAETPLWAGIYMLPLTVGFLVAAPVSGVLSDRFGARWFSSIGMVLSAASFVLLEILPINFDYWAFAAILLLNGLGMGLFTSPNRADIMNSLPAGARGAGAGMTATFQNSAMVLSIGFFFSLMIAGLAQNLPSVLQSGLVQHGVPAVDATRIAELPPVAVLFSAFLGFNPIQQLLGNVLGTLPADQAAFLTGRSFFPNLISGPFATGLAAAFWFAVAVCVVAAAASWFAGSRRPVLHDFALEGPGRVLGTVRSGSTPLTGALVLATDATGHVVGNAGTDQHGGFELPGLPVGATTVTASLTGHRPAATGVLVNLDLPARVELVLEPSVGGLAGIVSGPDGGALAGATVTASDERGDVVATVTTNGDGHYELAGLPPGCYTVVATTHAQAAVQLDLPAGVPTRVDLRLCADPQPGV
jgi:MFS family permease